MIIIGVKAAQLLGIPYVPVACAVIAVIPLFLYRLDQRALYDARSTSLVGSAVWR